MNIALYHIGNSTSRVSQKQDTKSFQAYNGKIEKLIQKKK